MGSCPPLAAVEQQIHSSPSGPNQAPHWVLAERVQEAITVCPGWEHELHFAGPACPASGLLMAACSCPSTPVSRLCCSVLCPGSYLLLAGPSMSPPVAPWVFTGLCTFWGLETENTSLPGWQQSLILASRVPVFRPPPAALSCHRTAAQGPALPPWPCRPACLNAICSLCPADQQTHSLG